METSEEKMRILKMIQDGKISAEEGIKLLEAIDIPEEEAVPFHSESKNGRLLKVRITDMKTGEDKVNFSIPVAIAHLIKSLIPDVELEKLEKQGVNLNLLFDSISSGQIGKLLDVEDKENQQHIEIFIE